MNWLAHWLGLDNPSGPIYAWWSGSGGVLLGDLGIFAAVIIWLRHHNCHTHGCWRLGHPHNGVVVCRSHINPPTERPQP